MKVFLSWSGPRSKHIATTLRDWLPLVLQAVEPWISVDIAKGQKWNDELNLALKESQMCIICLTKDNITSQYIHYEAGAISANEGSRNCTFLFDVKEKVITNPLSSFQNTKFDKDDIYKLISDMNSMLETRKEVRLKEELLKTNFDRQWTLLEEGLSKTPPISVDVPERTDEDILGEILSVVRRLDNATPNLIENWLDNLNEFKPYRARYESAGLLELIIQVLKDNKINFSEARNYAQLIKAQLRQLYPDSIFSDQTIEKNLGYIQTIGSDKFN